MPKRNSNELLESDSVLNLSTNGMCVETDDDVFDRNDEKEIEICLTDIHNRQISDMFMNRQYCDSILIIDGEDIPVNKSILSSRSQHFRALFFGEMKESKERVIELPDIKVKPFKHILNYIYSGKLYLNSMNVQLIIEVLQLSQYYCFEELVEHIVNYLKRCFTMNNIWVIRKSANLFAIPDLIRASNLFIDKNAKKILNSDSFATLLSSDLIEMFKRNSFYIKQEEEILNSVCFWFNQNYDSFNDKKIFEEILSSIRIKTIKKKKIKEIVEEWNLDYRPFTKFYEIQRKQDVKSRGSLVIDKNVASLEFNVKVLKGRRRNKMINFCSRWYTRGSNCTCHSIQSSGESQIMIALSERFIINHIVLVLFDIGKYSFNYKIEVSIDKKDWKLIIDHKNYLCRSYQYLFFSSQCVQYIRIVGTKSLLINDGSSFAEFEVLHFECMYCTIPIEIENNFVVPKVNVFDLQLKEIRISERKYLDISSCYPKKVGIDGKVISNNLIPFERGSICWFSENCVNFQLSQPFLIDSIAFKFNETLLTNTFSYYVEISIDYENWKIVQNMKHIEKNAKKEIIKFAKQPIVFIRIGSPTSLMPTHLKSFECPPNSIESTVEKRIKFNKKIN